MSENSGFNKESKFVQDIYITQEDLYPYEISPSNGISSAFNELKKDSPKLEPFHKYLKTAPESIKLLTNLFWLFFCVRFQPLNFKYVSVFYINLVYNLIKANL